MTQANDDVSYFNIFCFWLLVGVGGANYLLLWVFLPQGRLQELRPPSHVKPPSAFVGLPVVQGAGCGAPEAWSIGEMLFSATWRVKATKQSVLPQVCYP